MHKPRAWTWGQVIPHSDKSSYTPAHTNMWVWTCSTDASSILSLQPWLRKWWNRANDPNNPILGQNSFISHNGTWRGRVTDWPWSIQTALCQWEGSHWFSSQPGRPVRGAGGLALSDGAWTQSQCLEHKNWHSTLMHSIAFECIITGYQFSYLLNSRLRLVTGSLAATSIIVIRPSCRYCD